MKKLIIFTIFVYFSFQVNAQEGTTIFINYLPSMPLGETADFTNNISPRCMDFEVQKFLQEDLSVGFVIAWNLFREKIPTSTFDYQNLTITGTQFRYTNIIPLNLNVKKYFVGSNDMLPYLGVGLGTSYNEQRNEVGVLQVVDDKWLFNIAPEIGMLYDMNYKTFLSLKVKYSYSPKGGNFPSMSFLSLGIGIGLK